MLAPLQYKRHLRRSQYIESSEALVKGDNVCVLCGAACRLVLIIAVTSLASLAADIAEVLAQCCRAAEHASGTFLTSKQRQARHKSWYRQRLRPCMRQDCRGRRSKKPQWYILFHDIDCSAHRNCSTNRIDRCEEQGKKVGRAYYRSAVIGWGLPLTHESQQWLIR